jgi:hypothetical protein
MIQILAVSATLLQAVPQSHSGRQGDLEMEVPRVEAVSVTVDGVLSETEWTRAVRATGFTQYEPVEGELPDQETEVLVFYDAEAIYFGIRALDSQPDQILAHMSERDRSIFADDWVRIMLDTFDDARQAYVFYVNPYGIQTDGLWIEGLQSRMGSVSIDFNPDFIWESQGIVTNEGWQAEIRVPYASLRFRDQEEQVWGFNVLREVRRTGYTQAWAPITRDNPSTLAQSGRLRGLRELRPKRLVEVNPVATGRRIGHLDDQGNFRRDAFDEEFGLNARYGLTRNLTLDATLNPDFSQVEADVNRLTINERFALFFPEKRPFFLEGSEIFQMPRNLVYTRQIVDPLAGGKVTGKVGAFQVGYLGAVDESPSLSDADASDAVFNVIRARRDVGAGSTVGFVYTDRTVSDDDYNRVLGGDLRLLAGRHTFTAQVAGAWTGDPGGEALSGRPLFYTQVERSGRAFGWQLRLEGVDPEFRTRTGFINRTGDAQLFGQVRRAWFTEPGSFLESVSVALQSENFLGYDDLWAGRRPYEHELQLMATFSFRGGRTLTPIVRNSYFRFRAEDYAGWGVRNPDGTVGAFALPGSLRHLLGAGIVSRMRINNAVSLNGRVYVREIPIFLEAARGFEIQAAPDLTLRPTTSLSLTLGYTYSRITRDRDGSEFSTAQISRANLQYQFSRALMVRGLAQYDLQRRDGLIDPTTGLPITVAGGVVSASESGSFQAQLLLQYEPSPGTIFYVGYSRLERGDRGYDLDGMNPVEDGLFLKLSYLFRL